MIEKTSSQSEQIDLRTPWLAALLSWLVPGAGQFYQKRYTKAFIFSFCILGSFFYGVALGEGHPVYSSYYEEQETDDPRRNATFHKRNYGYLSQILLGVSTMPALVQAKRLEASFQQEPMADLQQPLEAKFRGMAFPVENEGEPVPVAGDLRLQYTSGVRGPVLEGLFQGKAVGSGETVELKLQEYRLDGDFPVEAPISASPEREVKLEVESAAGGRIKHGYRFHGSIPRSFVNWYQVPLQDEELQDLNARLGKRWELAMVFTWIAGLLNILCMWDAFEGPAYGYRPRGERKEDDAEPGPA